MGIVVSAFFGRSELLHEMRNIMSKWSKIWLLSQWNLWVYACISSWPEQWNHTIKCLIFHPGQYKMQCASCLSCNMMSFHYLMDGHCSKTKTYIWYVEGMMVDASIFCLWLCTGKQFRDQKKSPFKTTDFLVFGNCGINYYKLNFFWINHFSLT